MRRPGTASIFALILGIAQACRTSADVTRSRVSIPHGRMMRLSDSSNRRLGLDRSWVGTIKESYSRNGKSAYSYDQNH